MPRIMIIIKIPLICIGRADEAVKFTNQMVIVSLICTMLNNRKVLL